MEQDSRNGQAVQSQADGQAQVVRVLDEIAFEPDMSSLMKRLRIQADGPDVETLAQFVAEAQDVAKPKACYKIAYVESREEDSIVIDGVRFRSRVLRVNLESAYRVFPYVATCGVELEAWSQAIDDVLHQYWADAIKQMALFSATQVLHKHLVDTYHLGRTAVMSPGSLSDWPIREQRPLFELIGNVEDRIGVRLSDSFLMHPIKSVSGIRFPTEESFASCQLCPRVNCPGRRAPYDETLYDRKYR
jgi:cobalamin-dependent methionine synthase I